MIEIFGLLSAERIILAAIAGLLAGIWIELRQVRKMLAWRNERLAKHLLNEFD